MKDRQEKFQSINKSKNFSFIATIISLVGLLIASFSLLKSCEANRVSREANKIALMEFDEPIICIRKFNAIERSKPLNYYGNLKFKEDLDFVRTPDKVIRYDIENSLIIINESEIAATPFDHKPSVEIKISVKFPFRIFVVGILEVLPKNWTWEVSYEADKKQILLIKIYESLQSSQEFTIVFLYFIKKEQSNLGINEILSEYFKITVLSPMCRRTEPCQWVAGKIIKPAIISKNKFK